MVGRSRDKRFFGRHIGGARLVEYRLIEEIHITEYRTYQPKFGWTKYRLVYDVFPSDNPYNWCKKNGQETKKLLETHSKIVANI